MINVYKHKNLEWIDLVSPTQDEVRELYEKYALPPAVAEAFLTPSIKSKADRYPNCLYLALHFPLRQKGHSGMESREIDFCVGKDFLITTGGAEFGSVHEFSKLFEVSSILGNTEPFDHAGFLLYYLMRHLYTSLNTELTLISGNIADIEKKIFEGKEREMVVALSELSRTLLDFMRPTRLHGHVLESLSHAGKTFFGEAFSYHFKSMCSEYYTLEESASAALEALRELRYTNDSLVSTEQNQVVQVLTVIAFIALPLTVISSLFQIDAISRPIIGRPGDFWIIVILMAIIALSLYGYFKYKKWL